MRRTLVMAACAAALVITPPLAATAKCSGPEVAGAPIIGPADRKAIDRAVVTLPAARRGDVQMSVGALQPKSIETKPVPPAVKKVLPQYAGYQAFRTGHDLVIVRPGSRRLVYILPLRGSLSPACP